MHTGRVLPNQRVCLSPKKTSNIFSMQFTPPARWPISSQPNMIFASSEQHVRAHRYLLPSLALHNEQALVGDPGQQGLLSYLRSTSTPSSRATNNASGIDVYMSSLSKRMAKQACHTWVSDLSSTTLFRTSIAFDQRTWSKQPTKWSYIPDTHTHTPRIVQ